MLKNKVQDGKSMNGFTSKVYKNVYCSRGLDG